MHWIHLTQDSDQWLFLVNMKISIFSRMGLGYAADLTTAKFRADFLMVAKMSECSLAAEGLSAS